MRHYWYESLEPSNKWDENPWLQEFSALGIEVDETLDEKLGPMIKDLAMGSLIDAFNEQNPKQAVEDVEHLTNRTTECMFNHCETVWNL